jgi:hypothetical protein
MTEKGSDELLAEIATSQEIRAGVDADQEALDEEEARVTSVEPEDDPGKQYPDPDETPDGEPEENDTNPPGGM